MQEAVDSLTGVLIKTRQSREDAWYLYLGTALSVAGLSEQKISRLEQAINDLVADICND
jgi:hypothetical protein